MFKIFKGFDLVESLHQNKQIRRLEKLPKHFVALAFTLAVTLTLWNLPIEMFGIPELTIVQQRTIALFAFATLSGTFLMFCSYLLLLLAISSSEKMLPPPYHNAIGGNNI